MRRLLTTTLVASALLVLPTACGTAPTSGSASGTPSGTAPTNQSSNTVATNSTNSTTTTGSGTPTTSAASIQLQPFTDGQTGVSVQVPAGWTQTTLSGGDYTGWKFTNPNDANQYVKVIRSSCVGCYMLNGTPNPKQPIPEQNATNVALSTDGLSATYNFSVTGNTNPGQGMLTVTKNSSGYAYVETVLPQASASVASQILQSFALKS